MKQHVATLKHRSTCDNEMNVVMLCNANAQMLAKHLWCYTHTLLRLLHGCHRHQWHLPGWRCGRPGATPAHHRRDASQPLAPLSEGRGSSSTQFTGEPRVRQHYRRHPGQLMAEFIKRKVMNKFLTHLGATGWRCFRASPPDPCGSMSACCHF
jgi:hypothetical protein